MYRLKIFRNVCFVTLLFIMQLFYMVNAYTFDPENGRVVSNRYFEDRFEVSVPGLPTEYKNLTCNLEGTKVEIEDGKIIIRGLVPDQVYNNVEIMFVDNLGRKYEFSFDNVITSNPTKPDNKFVYFAYENGLGRKPDHLGFKYWYEKLSTHSITAIEFIQEMITSDEFNSTYKEAGDRINALYKTIVGREPEEDGLIFWLDQYNILVDELNYTHREAILNLVNRMVSEDEFITIVDNAGFLYK